MKEESEESEQESKDKTEAIKKAEKVYRKLLPKINQNSKVSVAQKMAESAMMAKCLSRKLFKSGNLRSSRRYSNAISHIQKVSDSPEYSIWRTGWDPRDEPKDLSVANHVSQASAIDFAGSIQNLRNQDLPTFTGTKSDDELKKIHKIGKTLSKYAYEDSEFNQLKTRTKSRTHSKFDLKINLSVTPVLKFGDLSTDFDRPNSRAYWVRKLARRKIST